MAAICVYTASSRTIDPAYVELATRVGRRIAERGHDLVSGGGSVSMMGAVARAAREAGGCTYGVIPRSLFGLEFADRDSTELVEVENMRDRKAEMDRRADAFLALPGGIGTLEELFEIWTSAYLGMHAKPVAVLDPDGFYEPLWAWLRTVTEQGFVRQVAWDALITSQAVDDVLDRIEKRLDTGPGFAPPTG